MNAARIQKQIDQLREDLTARLDDLARAVAEETGGGVPIVYLSIEEYADRSRVSVATVRKWLREGLPCVRRGRVVRVKVAEADAWTPAAEREASARHAAHRGPR